MLMIKLSPLGKTHGIRYRVVVIEKRTKLTGDPREVLGNFDPQFNKLDISQDRLQYWLAKGAQPSAQMRRLLKL